MATLRKRPVVIPDPREDERESRRERELALAGTDGDIRNLLREPSDPRYLRCVELRRAAGLGD